MTQWCWEVWCGKAGIQRTTNETSLSPLAKLVKNTYMHSFTLVQMKHMLSIYNVYMVCIYGQKDNLTLRFNYKFHELVVSDEKL